MKTNKEITNFAIIELGLLGVATFICFFIKLYTNYDIGWVVCFYPLFAFICFNLGIIFHSMCLLFGSILYKKNKEVNDD